MKSEDWSDCKYNQFLISILPFKWWFIYSILKKKDHNFYPQLGENISLRNNTKKILIKVRSCLLIKRYIAGLQHCTIHILPRLCNDSNTFFAFLKLCARVMRYSKCFKVFLWDPPRVHILLLWFLHGLYIFNNLFWRDDPVAMIESGKRRKVCDSPPSIPECLCSGCPNIPTSSKCCSKENKFEQLSSGIKKTFVDRSLMSILLESHVGCLLDDEKLKKILDKVGLDLTRLKAHSWHQVQYFSHITKKVLK